jgi:2-aminobenzoate-CoA ligase
MSAHIDRFVIDRLPPAARQAQMLRDLPELHFPDQLNLVHELLDRVDEKGWGDRPLLRSPRITLSYREARERVNRIAHSCWESCNVGTWLSSIHSCRIYNRIIYE